MRLTVQNVRAAIERYSGNITAVAKSLRVSRQAIYNKIHQHESLREDLHTARETMIDNVESTLYRQALDGNTTAMIFFLKTQGRSRGYVERRETDITSGGKPLKTYVAVSPDDWEDDDDHSRD